MPEYVYTSRPNPYVGSIGDLMLRRGDIAAQRGTSIADIEARAAMNVADAQSRAAIASGDAWGRTIGNIGNAVAGTIQRAIDPQQQMQRMQLDRAKQLQAGEQVIDRALQPAVPNGPQPEGEAPASAQHPYLDDQGLYDIPKLTQALAASGMTHLAPELLKGAEQINDSITHHQAAVDQAKVAQQKVADQQTVMYGDMAAGVMKMVKAGMSFEQALDLASAPGLATKRIDPQQFAKIRAQLVALPPEQQQAALTHIMDQAAQLGGGKTLAKDAKEVDRYGRPVASNMVPDKPTEASLAADAATLGTPQETPTAKQSAAALDRLKPPKNPLPLEQQLLEAIAKGDDGGKQRILDTMQAEATAKRDPVATAQLEELRKLSMEQARARLEDADPQSNKNQQKFEQEYRAVLQRTLSSRSGGLGMEDQKVNQAIHLLTLFDQQKDPKTGAYNIPKMMVPEVALGLARLISPTGQPAESTVKELEQRTAAGDIAGVITYLTGEPVTGSTQAIFKTLRDSIERQGRVAEQNREAYFDSIRAFAPTDLAEDRRKSLETGLKLNRLPAATKPPAPTLTPGLRGLANR